MGRLLPFQPETTHRPDEPKVLDLEAEATAEMLSALSSETAREILSTVYEEPRTPPEIRDEVGTSLQNVHYHLENLEDAELIQPAGSGYSEKGTEMTVFAPANEAVVLFAGQERHHSRLKTALARLLGAVGLLAVASLAIQRLFGPDGTTGEAAPGTGVASLDNGTTTTRAATEATDGGLDVQDVGDSGVETTGTAGPAGTPSATDTPILTESSSATPTSTPTDTPADTPTAADAVTNMTTNGGTPLDGAEAALGLGQGLDPAVAFFLGGLFMLIVIAGWRYWQVR